MPSHGVWQELEDGTVRYAVVLGQALGRRALMDLLYTLAPYKAHGPDRFARVLDNWALHDRAAGANNGASLALVALHAQSLKLSWQVFTGATLAVALWRRTDAYSLRSSARE